jgi:hypothetical protein
VRYRGMDEPAPTSGIGRDSITLCFRDLAFGYVLVGRFCCGYWIGTITGAFIMCNDAQPAPRAAPLRMTPEPLSSPRPAGRSVRRVSSYSPAYDLATAPDVATQGSDRLGKAGIIRAPRPPSAQLFRIVARVAVVGSRILLTVTLQACG